MNYTIKFPGFCGCSSNQGIYGTNMWNNAGNQPNNTSTCHPQAACNGCIDIIKGVCVHYTGPDLLNLGVNKNDDLDTILGKLDALKKIQDQKNTNLLAAINDLNARLNVIEPGPDHPPYTML